MLSFCARSRASTHCTVAYIGFRRVRVDRSGNRSLADESQFVRRSAKIWHCGKVTVPGLHCHASLGRIYEITYFSGSKYNVHSPTRDTRRPQMISLQYFESSGTPVLCSVLVAILCSHQQLLSLMGPRDFRDTRLLVLGCFHAALQARRCSIAPQDVLLMREMRHAGSVKAVSTHRSAC